MENKNFEYTGWKINGFVALFAILASIVGAVLLIGSHSVIPCTTPCTIAFRISINSIAQSLLTDRFRSAGHEEG